MTKENKWFIIAALAFSAGIVLGGLYCAFVNGGSQLYEYMQGFIETVKNGADSSTVMKKVFINNLKITVFFTLCVFVRFGFAPICAAATVKGFAMGFTFAALFKFFGKNGIFVMLSQLPSSVIIFAVIVFYGAVCAKISTVKKDKPVAAVHAVSFFFAVLVSLLGAALAGYVDTYIIKCIAVKFY